MELINYEAINIKYYECVSAFLSQLTDKQIASFLRRIVMPVVACPALQYFSAFKECHSRCVS